MTNVLESVNPLAVDVFKLNRTITPIIGYGQSEVALVVDPSEQLGVAIVH